MNDIGLLALSQSLAQLAQLAEEPKTPECKLCLPNNLCWWHREIIMGKTSDYRNLSISH